MSKTGKLVVLLAVVAFSGCGAGSTGVGSVNRTGSIGTSSSALRPVPSTSGPSAGSNTGEPSGRGATSTGQPPSDSSAHAEAIKPEDRLDKLPLLAAVGSAFAAFHQYVSKPLRRHALSSGRASSPAVATAAIATVFAQHKLTEAVASAKGSEAFARFAVPLGALKLRLASIEAGLRTGQVDVGAIVAARGEVNSISLQALAVGRPIQEVVPKLP